MGIILATIRNGCRTLASVSCNLLTADYSWTDLRHVYYRRNYQIIKKRSLADVAAASERTTNATEAKKQKNEKIPQNAGFEYIIIYTQEWLLVSVFLVC